MPKVVPTQIVEYIDARFPTVREQFEGKEITVGYDRSSHVAVNTIIELLDQLPPNLLIISGEDFICYVEAVIELKKAVAFWGSDHADKRKYQICKMSDGSNLNPITFIRIALSKCPDQGIDATTNDLVFITDTDFRESLRQDISFVNQALNNAEWKAVTILAGSVIEALLLYEINRIKENDPRNFKELRDKVLKDDRLGKPFDSKFPNTPNKWHLYQYIPFALTAEIISESTAKGCLVAKDFRNLIHPGASIRKNIRCDRGTALKSVGGMEHVIKDLS